MKISDIITEKVLNFKGRKKKVDQPAVDRREKMIQYKNHNYSFKSMLILFSDMLGKGEISSEQLPGLISKDMKKTGAVAKPEAMALLNKILSPQYLKDTEVPEIRNQLRKVMRLSNITKKDKEYISDIAGKVRGLDKLPEPELSDEEYWGKPEYFIMGDPSGQIYDTRREADIALKKLKLQGHPLGKVGKVLQLNGVPDEVTDSEDGINKPQEPRHDVIIVDDDGDEERISSHKNKKEAIMRAKEESLKRPGRPKIKVVSIGE